ncbi:MAG: hypothetical protein R3362_10515 [Rhodothermales bacterium]|nr:hypothetical protein [Rhodothermales bacterium]
MFVPEYNKPEQPGIALNFDNTVSVYHVVAEGDAFEQAARDIVDLVREAEARFPGWPRVLYLDIVGHIDEQGRFTEDFVELQQEFLFACVAPFVTALETPLTGGLVNPDPQRDDLPDALQIDPPKGA